MRAKIVTEINGSMKKRLSTWKSCHGAEYTTKVSGRALGRRLPRSLNKHIFAYTLFR